MRAAAHTRNMQHPCSAIAELADIGTRLVEHLSAPSSRFTCTSNMSFRLPLKHYFRVEDRRSNDQLTMDFGEFPPFPLRCTEKDSVVRIVRAAGIGGLLNCLQISRKWFFVGSSGPDVSIRSSIESEMARYGAMELVELLNSGTRRCPIGVRPLVVRGFMLALVLFQAWVLSRIMYRRENGPGVFFPTDDSSGRISLTEASMSLKAGIEPVLSHEHLHFLQHRDGERHGKVVKNLSQFIREKAAATSRCSISSKNEKSRQDSMKWFCPGTERRRSFR